MLRLTTCVCLVAVILGACTGSAFRGDATAVTEPKESLTDKAWKLRNDGAPADQFINVQKSAVAQLRRGESPDDAVTVLEQMGLFYQIVGDYANALLYYQEAVDSLKNIPLRSRNEGAIQLFGDLSSLYRLVGMQQEALAYNDSALVESRRQGGVMSADVYVSRANIFADIGEVDSIGRCYDLGVAAVMTGRTNADKDYLVAYINAERAYSLLEDYPEDTDSVQRAVILLRRMLEFDNAYNSPYEFSLGYGLCLLGNVSDGLPMMEEAARAIADQEDIDLLVYAQKKLMQQYVRSGLGDRMLKLYPDYEITVDSLFNLKKTEYIIGASIRYETEKKSMEIEMLASRLAIKKMQTTSIVLGSIVVALVLGIVIALIVKRYRRERHKRQEIQGDLVTLQKSHDENLKRTHMLEQDLTLKINSNNELLSTPQLITTELQGKFSRAFHALYPDVIPSIKKKHPEITANDEIVCMLIFLKHTTDEVAAYLGISRQSVNTTRYRLRQKLHLPENVKLDAYIQSFPGQ